jgi:hypothetical protein
MQTDATEAKDAPGRGDKPVAQTTRGNRHRHDCVPSASPRQPAEVASNAERKRA